MQMNKIERMIQNKPTNGNCNENNTFNKYKKCGMQLL